MNLRYTNNFSIKSGLFFALFILLQQWAMAQTIMNGKVQEIESKSPMFGVYVENINLQKGVMTDSFGNFSLEVRKGDLIEVQKYTYKTLKIRIPHTAIPNFFVLDMEFDMTEIDTLQMILDAPQRVRDSIKKTEIFRTYLNFYKKEDVNPLTSPFEFLSKRNQQIWAFQKAFDFWEQEKFIDFMFNDKLILKVTDLNETALPAYKHYFRPPYYLLKTFQNEYDYYMYIKQTSIEFLRRKELHNYQP